MKKKRWLLLGLALVMVGVAASYIGTVRSYLAGEAFYRGKPASYWARELAKWEAMKMVPVGDDPSKVPVFFVRPLTDWERWLQGKLPVVARLMPSAPPILNGDTAALPVLIVLAENENPDIRVVALSGLGGMLKNTQAVAAVQKKLDDPDENVRREAKVILEARGVVMANAAPVREDEPGNFANHLEVRLGRFGGWSQVELGRSAVEYRVSGMMAASLVETVAAQKEGYKVVASRDGRLVNVSTPNGRVATTIRNSQGNFELDVLTGDSQAIRALVNEFVDAVRESAP